MRLNNVRHRDSYSQHSDISYSIACLVCDDKEWVCEEHPDRPWRRNDQRADECDCGPGMPARMQSLWRDRRAPAISPIAPVTLDKNGPRRHQWPEPTGPARRRPPPAIHRLHHKHDS
jgi:hypothetical protein